MKKFLLVLTLCLSFQGFSQDPDLVRIWYLTFVQSTDIDTPYTVSEISPSIYPFMEIYGDSSFNGEAACNSFNGISDFSIPENFETLELNFNTEECGFQIHNLFENSFFSFLISVSDYYITENAEGLILNMGNPLMGSAIFQDYPLSTNSFILNNITLYPNPVNSNLYLNTNTILLSEIEVYSASGKKVLGKSGNTNTIDLSNLKSGIYFLKLHTEDAFTVKKIIKH